MKDKLRTLQAKAISARYGNPDRSLSIILIAGAHGKTTTAVFLESILKEAGRNPAILTNAIDDTRYDASAMAFFQTLSNIKKKNGGTVLIEVSEALLASGALLDLQPELLLIPEENAAAYQLLALRPKHIVAPSGYEVPEGTVASYQQISFGHDEQADAKIDSTTLYRHGTEISMTIDHQTKLELATYFSGLANANDLVAATAAAYVLGVNIEAVQEGIADLESPKTSFFWYTSDRPYALVYDQAVTASSVELAVESAKKLTKRRLIVALDSEPSDDIVDKILPYTDRLFVVSDSEPRSGVDIETSVVDAYDKALRAAKREDTVLLLGKGFKELIATYPNTVSKDDSTA